MEGNDVVIEWLPRKTESKRVDNWLLDLPICIFGVNPGYAGRYVRPKIAWILQILNLCYSVTLTYLLISRGHFGEKIDFSVNCIARKAYFYLATIVIVIIQVRFLIGRHKMGPLGRELARLKELSTWQGDLSGCIARMLLHIATCILHQFLPAYRSESEGWRTLIICFYFMNYVPSSAAEFFGQAMMLFQHEFKVLSKIAESMTTRRDCDIENLRALNRRHASLAALANSLTRITGMDNLLMIESERILILLNIFIRVNSAALVPVDWYNELIGVMFYSYRIERIVHYCFRGHRVVVEAEGFVSTLDKIDPLDFERDEFFTEIFRKQLRLRKPHFDCNRFLKLDMKLIFQISRDLFTLIIILVQLTSSIKNEALISSNTKKATTNFTKELIEFS